MTPRCGGGVHTLGSGVAHHLGRAEARCYAAGLLVLHASGWIHGSWWVAARASASVWVRYTQP